MANVMLREQDGKLSIYIAKKDLEANVASLEFDQADKWGGKIELEDGTAYYLEPMDSKPKLPKTVRVTRG